MSHIGDFLGETIGGITGAKQSGQAMERAGQTQAASYGQGIKKQEEQFNKLIELMAPYVTGGYSAFSAQQALTGLLGADQQKQAIGALEGSPMFQSLAQQGENSILQNASATGGLRGGNTQGALAQFRPNLLNSLLEQQYGRLGGISQMGQAAASGQAAQGMQSANSIANLLAGQGSAIAGGQVAQGNVVRQSFGDLMGLAQMGGNAAKAGIF